MALKRLSLLFVIALASGLIAAGCGGDDDDDGGDGAAGDISVATDISVPTTAEEAEEVQESVSEAVKDAAGQAKQACLDSAENLPEPQKSQAIDACNQIQD